MRAAVVGNGRMRTPRAFREVLRRADLIICADGGVRLARAAGVVPHLVIGDLDSVDTPALAWARRRGARVIIHPREKDKTDTELAVEHAVAAGAGEIDLLGVLGGRVDHALANIALLIAVAEGGRRARILDGRAELFLADAQGAIPGEVGDLVSLIPLSDTVTGVATRGLLYPLTGGVLRITSTLGISNEITALPASVTVKDGRLLVVVTHRHR